MIQRQQSREDILRKQYKDSISCFLKASQLYDCLSINNQVTVIDQSFSLMDVFKVFLENNLDEVLFWNPDVANYDGVFTHSDLIKAWTTSKITPIIEVEEETYQQKLTIDQHNQLLHDLKAITIKLWLNTSDDLHQSSLIKGVMEDNLNDSCKKIIRQGVTRIVVVDKESRMITGIIQQRDILAFMIKGFSQYFNMIVGHRIIEENHQDQHELEIGYFKEQIMQYNYTLPDDEILYQVFYKLIYKFKRNSIPIVDRNGQYVGLVDRRDFSFIIRYQMFDLLAIQASKFISLVKAEKHKYAAYAILNQQFFRMNQTLKEVVENLILAQTGCLVCLSSDNRLIATIQISDLFNLCLESDD